MTVKPVDTPTADIPAIEPGLWNFGTAWYKFFERVARRLNLQDAGWTASTGAANKGAYATYAGHACSVVYVQAEAQATDDAVKAVSQRLKAIEDALRANGGIN